MKKYIFSTFALFVVSAGFVLAATPMIGAQKLAVILFNFKGDPLEAREPATKEQIKKMIFTDVDSMNAFYQQTSFNQAWFEGFLDKTGGDVFGWYTIDAQHPINRATYCSPDKPDGWIPKAKAAAEAAGVDLRGYTKVLYIYSYDRNEDCNAPGGEAAAGGGFAQMEFYKNRTKFIATAAHELGHAYGLGHAESLACLEDSKVIAFSDNCIYSDFNGILGDSYGDPFDTMGGSANQFSSFRKAILGWLQPNNILEVTQSGVYTIKPSELDVDGPQLLVINRNTGSELDPNAFFYLDFRQPDGRFDKFSADGNTIARGVSIRTSANYKRAGDYVLGRTYLIDTIPTTGTLLDAPLTPNQSPFIDAKTGISIKTLSVSPTEATVQVTFNKLDLTAPAGGETYHLVKTGDSFSLPLGAKWDTGGNLNSLVFKIFGPASLRSGALSPGSLVSSHSPTLSAQNQADKTWSGIKSLSLGNGVYTVAAEASVTNSSSGGYSRPQTITSLPTYFVVDTRQIEMSSPLNNSTYNQGIIPVNAKFIDSSKTGPTPTKVSRTASIEMQLLVDGQKVVSSYTNDLNHSYNATSLTGRHSFQVIRKTPVETIYGPIAYVTVQKPGEETTTTPPTVTSGDTQAPTFSQPTTSIFQDPSSGQYKTKVTVNTYDDTDLYSISGTNDWICTPSQTNLRLQTNTSATCTLERYNSQLSNQQLNLKAVDKAGNSCNLDFSTNNNLESLNSTGANSVFKSLISLAWCAVNGGTCASSQTTCLNADKSSAAQRVLPTIITSRPYQSDQLSQYFANISLATDCGSKAKTSWFTNPTDGKTVYQCASAPGDLATIPVVTNSWLQFDTCTGGTQSGWFLEKLSRRLIYQCNQRALLTNGLSYISRSYLRYDDCGVGDIKSSWFFDVGAGRTIYQCVARATYNGATTPIPPVTPPPVTSPPVTPPVVPPVTPPSVPPPVVPPSTAYDFSLSSSVSSISVKAGGFGVSTIGIRAISGVVPSPGVVLSVSGLPSGVTSSLTVTTAPVGSGTYSSLLTLTTSGSVAPGSYPITITGKAGSISRTASVNLIVSDSTNYTISGSISPAVPGITFAVTGAGYGSDSSFCTVTSAGDHYTCSVYNGVFVYQLNPTVPTGYTINPTSKSFNQTLMSHQTQNFTSTAPSTPPPVTPPPATSATITQAQSIGGTGNEIYPANPVYVTGTNLPLTGRAYIGSASASISNSTGTSLRFTAPATLPSGTFSLYILSDDGAVRTNTIQVKVTTAEEYYQNQGASVIQGFWGVLRSWLNP